MIHLEQILVILSLLAVFFAEAAITLDEKIHVINLHNSIRKSHSNTPPLIWNKALAKKSQLFVESCQYKDRSSTLKLYKELSALDNAASGYSSWSDVVDAWYSGNEDYDYEDPGYTSDTGAFVTMLWKDSTQIGCSSFKCAKDDTVLYQCLYSPSIPYKSLFDEKAYKLNVLPS